MTLTFDYRATRIGSHDLPVHNRSLSLCKSGQATQLQRCWSSERSRKRTLARDSSDGQMQPADQRRWDLLHGSAARSGYEMLRDRNCPHVQLLQSSAFRNCLATNSGSVSSSFSESQVCSWDLSTSDTDTKRMPKCPAFDQQIVDFAKNCAS